MSSLHSNAAVILSEITTPQNAVLGVTQAVKLLLFETHTMQKSIMARWASSAETTVKTYELQRCTKPPEFITIATLAPTGTSGGPATYHYEDENILFNQVYYYRLKMIDSAGAATFSKTSSAALDDKKGLFEATNHPFQTSSEISYELLQTTTLAIEVFDFMGKYECTILKTTQKKGYYNTHFSAKERGLPAGVYCIRMIQGKATYNKMVYVE
jgi:hypothetical protein